MDHITNTTIAIGFFGTFIIGFAAVWMWAAITTWLAGLMGFLGDIHKEWHDGRQLAQMVAENTSCNN
jgi:hypothetical protein